MKNLGIQELNTQELATIEGGCWDQCWGGFISGAAALVLGPALQLAQPIIGAYNAGYEAHNCK